MIDVLLTLLGVATFAIITVGVIWCIAKIVIMLSDD